MSADLFERLRAEVESTELLHCSACDEMLPTSAFSRYDRNARPADQTRPAGQYPSDLVSGPLNRSAHMCATIGTTTKEKNMNVETMTVVLPVDIVDQMRKTESRWRGTDPKAEGTWTVAMWARALVEHNPEPEPPLQTGDWVTVPEDDRERIVASVTPQGWVSSLVWDDERGYVWHDHPLTVDKFTRVNAPEDPEVRAALLRCIGREDET